MKLSKNLVIGTSVGLAVIGIWLILRGKKKPNQTPVYTDNNNNNNNNNNNYNPTPTPTPKNDNFPLKRGSYGARVKELQLVLLKYDANILPQYGVDGDFGAETENALLKVSGKKTVDTQSELDALKYSKAQFQ
jgi:hypothetical protein